MNRSAVVLGGLLVGIGIMTASKPVGRKGPLPNKRASHYRPGRADGPPIWVVIHTAEIDERNDAAEALESYAARHETPVSWHYAVDADSITQSVAEQDTAFACGPGNTRSVNIELAGRASQSPESWQDAYSRAVLERAALLTREVCERWRIPRVRIGRDEVLAFRSGICGHDTITAASRYAKAHELSTPPWYDGARFRTSTHTDPGSGFPWSDFLRLVNE